MIETIFQPSMISFCGAVGAPGLGGGSALPIWLPLAANLSFEQIGVGVAFIALCIPAAVGIKTLFWPGKQKLETPVDINVVDKAVPERVCKLNHASLERRVGALEEGHKELAASQKALRETLDEKFTALDQKRSRDVGALHLEIDSLHGRITDGMTSLNSEIAALPGKIINLLNQTAKLHKK